MGKKELEEKLRGLVIFTEGDGQGQATNTTLEEELGEYAMQKVLDLFSQELDKAREEVLQRVLILEDADVNQEGEMTGLGTVHIDAILYEFEQDMKCWKKLSKLTTK